MAEFQRLGRIEATELVGGTRTRTVRVYSFLELPDQVYFIYRDPPPYADKARVSAVAQNLANRIAGVLALPGVTGAASSEDIAPNGQLIDIWTVYWRTPSGLSVGEVDDIKQPNFTPAAVAPLVASAIADARGFE